MKYKINWCEAKTTSTGKVKLDASLIDEKGIEVNKVSIWGDFPGFAELAPGSEVEGDLVASKDPKYGPTLYPPRQNLGPKPAWAKGPSGAVKAAEITRESVRTAQDRKEVSIAYFNSCNLAVQVLGTNFDKEVFCALRDFFFSEWQKWEAQPTEDKKQAF